MDFQSFGKRQRGAEISVHRNRVSRIARRAGKLQSGAEIILAHRNRRKLCRKSIRMAHDPGHECIRIRPGPDEVAARRAVGIVLNGGFDGRNEPLRRLAFKLIDHARGVAVPVGIGRIGVLAHRHAPAHHVKPRPGGFARKLHDDRHVLGENALPLPRPAGENHDLCGLCGCSVRQGSRRSPIGLAPGGGPALGIANRRTQSRWNDHRQHNKPGQDFEKAPHTRQICKTLWRN